MIIKNPRLKLFLISFFVIIILLIPSVIPQPSPSLTINVKIKEYGKPERTETTAQIHTSLTSKEGRNCLQEKIGNIIIDVKQDNLTPIKSPNCTHLKDFCVYVEGIPTAEETCIHNMNICMDEANTEIIFNCDNPDNLLLGELKL